ncbi:hxlR-like helix-turn-helix family protein [Mycobacterium ulcerans str. Harvey]|uniref:HxlR-like helix-turn-helix family protein n=1 Tax=Mycobacterium ulcerans str. Harvey TaxID=1299332 RepID=A0ABN0QXS2_MYCUL|nr:hxlR-like helix-turn-helix family protein [Mycobacterium ulcerans str. Harvey]
MAVVGTKSAMLIMREAYYGTTRFDDFARRVGITKAATSARLAELVSLKLLARRPYREPGSAAAMSMCSPRPGLISCRWSFPCFSGASATCPAAIACN